MTHPDHHDHAGTCAGTCSRSSENHASGQTIALGQALWLAMKSPAHWNLSLHKLEAMMIPPLKLNQFRLFTHKGAPFAFASWALVPEAHHNRKIKEVPALDEWNTGDRPLLVDIIVPFGGLKLVLDDLKEKVFLNRTIQAVEGVSARIMGGSHKPPGLVGN